MKNEEESQLNEISRRSFLLLSKSQKTDDYKATNTRLLKIHRTHVNKILRFALNDKNPITFYGFSFMTFTPKCSGISSFHLTLLVLKYFCSKNKMFQIGKTIVSEEILENDFVCNLNACKGACCVDGEYGAPLEDHETEILVDIFSDVKPYLRPEGVQAIMDQGAFVKGEDGEWETPLVNNSECAYVVFSPDGIAKCGLEDAYNDGVIKWKKPVSCHLYPVRVREYSEFTAVNYHQWEICDPACSLGNELKVPIYKFVKDALIRKFGKAWYQELEEVARENAK